MTGLKPVIVNSIQVEALEGDSTAWAPVVVAILTTVLFRCDSMFLYE